MNTNATLSEKQMQVAAEIEVEMMQDLYTK